MKQTSWPRHRRTAAHATMLLWAIALAVALWLATLMVTHAQKNVSTALAISAVIVLALVLMTVRAVRMIPAPTVPRIPRVADADRAERQARRRLTSRRWERACHDAGLSIADRSNPDKTIISTPRVTDVAAVPLGLRLTVEAIPGQSPDDIQKRRLNLSSALSMPLDVAPAGARTVTLTARLRDPLTGIRPAGQSTTTEIVIGRTEDGTDAKIDIASASHIILQGMTRSGKSALCYTIFGQLRACPEIHVLGIDPNAVLLKPLSDATDSANFVLNSDPAASLALIDRVVSAMNDRLALLGEMNIEAHKATAEFPYLVFILEEYPALLRAAAVHDSGVKAADKVMPKIRAGVARLVSEGAKAGIRLLIISQRADAEIVDGNTRGQFGTRITMAVDNGDAIRMLHPSATAGDPELVSRVMNFPPGRCLYWRAGTGSVKVMQADYTDYEEYRRRLGLDPAPEPNYSEHQERGKVS